MTAHGMSNEPFKCSGCGKPAPDLIKPCGCVTMCGFRDGETCVFKEAAKQQPMVDERELSCKVANHLMSLRAHLPEHAALQFADDALSVLRPYLVTDELALLREFHAAATDRGCASHSVHEHGCPYWRSGKSHGPCSCGAKGKQSRIDAAKAALASHRNSTSNSGKEPE